MERQIQKWGNIERAGGGAARDGTVREGEARSEIGEH